MRRGCGLVVVEYLRSKLPCGISGLYSDYEIYTQYYIKPVSDGIRCKLPHSLQSLSDFEIYTQYYNILRECL